MGSHPSGIPFEKLLAQRTWVRALARSLVKDDARSDDIEQQTWLAALREASGPAHPRAWLATVLRREAAAERRQEGRRAERERSAARPEAVRPTADVVADAEVHRAVVDAVLALEEPYRSTVLLRYFEALPPREIARRLGVPVETVRARTKRGVALLRGRLAPYAAAIAGLAGWGRRAAAGGIAVTLKQKALGGAVLLVLLCLAFVTWRWRGSPDPNHHAPGSTLADTRTPEPVAGTPPEPAARAEPVGCPVLVVGADGAGIGSARVTVVRDEATDVGETDPKGLVRFRDAGPCVLWASAPGHALKRLECSLSNEETRVALERGGIVRLVFADPQGLFLTGAEAQRRYDEAGIRPAARVLPQEVFDWWGDAAHASIPLPEDAWQITAPFAWTEDGAEIGPLSAGRWRFFMARPHATERLSGVLLVHDGATTSVRVKLPEAGKRRVRVVRGDDGRPLPAARVHARFRLQPDVAGLPGAQLVADGRGEVELPLSPASDVNDCMWHFEAEGWRGVLWPLEFAKAAENPVEVRLSPAWTALGTAFRADGEPAAATRVYCVEEGRVLVTRTDADGRFRFTGLGQGLKGMLDVSFTLVESRDPPLVSQCLVSGEAWRLTDAGKRFERLRSQALEAAMAARRDPQNDVLRERHQSLVRELKQTHGEVRRASPSEIEVRIGAPAAGGARIEGRISSGGLALPDVRVSVDSYGTSQTAVTDRSGEFVIRGVADKCNVYVTWGYSAFGRPTLVRGDDLAVPESGVRRLDLDFPAGEIAVTVVDATTGKAIPRARVTAGPANIESQAGRFEGLYYLAGWNAVVNEDGNATLRCLVPGEAHAVAAEADGYEEKQAADVRPGSPDAPLRLEIALEPAAQNFK